jgi:hypothetical protein
MNIRKFALNFFTGKLPIEIIIKICQYLPRNQKELVDRTKRFKYSTGNRKDKLRYHIHYH